MKKNKQIYGLIGVMIVGFIGGMAIMGNKPEWTAFIYWLIASMWALFGINCYYKILDLEAEKTRLSAEKLKERARAKCERRRPETIKIFEGLPERIKTKERRQEQAKVYEGDFVREL